MVISEGGIVLWSRSFTPAAAQVASSSASPVNSLIREALIEGRAAEENYEKDGYALKWSFINDLELIFVVRALHLVSSHMPDLILLFSLVPTRSHTSAYCNLHTLMNYWR
jgi:signal recognition particle receptor subunit alpha